MSPLRNRTSSRRRGIAAVEFAVCVPILLLLLLGIWEVGRMVEIEQVVFNSAREGARVAAAGAYIDSLNNAHNITTTDVQNRVNNYIQAHALDTTGLQVQFVDVTTGGVSDPYLAHPTTAGDTVRDTFYVTVSLPFNNVRWVILPLVTGTTNVTAISGTVLGPVWHTTKNIPFNVDTTVPVWNPLQ
jgi:Flp pilus assembly protein TadG